MTKPSLQARAKILALRLERERRERVRNVPCRPERLRLTDDVRDLMDGIELPDGSEHSGTVWVGRSFGLAPEGPQTIMAHRQDEAFLIRDGKRRKATTYTDAPFPSGRVRNKANRLAVGQAKVEAGIKARNPEGIAEPMPERGFLPCAPQDTLAHGRSAMSQRLWLAHNGLA